MPLKVSFEISEKDIRHFRREMRRALEAVRIADDEDIVAAARQSMQDVVKSNVPEFVRVRIDKLELLLAMIGDEEWALARKECEKVLSALAYFGDPDDMIPDHIPGLGFLDDAIMVELVLRELVHEIDAYQDFCEYRNNYARRFEGDDPDLRGPRLRKTRERLVERLKRRNRRDKKGRGRRNNPALW